MKHHDRTLRIIGGNWRGRKITFPQDDVIRPTGDRIRETLFNWLMHEVPGARCLDLFAGSGALGFEALSRGAALVTWVEENPKIAQHIQDNAEKLAAEEANYQLIISNAYEWVTQPLEPYDIIFLDPPFSDERLEDLLTKIAISGLAKQSIYIETAKPLEPEILPDNWQLLRQKSTGAVSYALCSVVVD